MKHLNARNYSLLFMFVLLLFAVLLVQPAFANGKAFLPDASPPQIAAPAAIFNVNVPFDAPDAFPGDMICDDGFGNCTLRAAVMEANALPGPDTIQLFVPNAMLTVGGPGDNCDCSGDLDITDNVDIWGMPGGPPIIIDGMGLDRIFHVDPFNFGINVTFGSIALINGAGTFEPVCGFGPTCGGAVLIEPAARVTMIFVDVGGSFGGNEAQLGGGVYNAGLLNTDMGSISNNGAATGIEGGGLYNSLSGNANLALTTVSANATTGNGAGILNQGNLTLNNLSIINNNSSGGNGGGIANLPGAVANIDGVIIDTNTAPNSGGGIANQGELYSRSSVIMRNNFFGAGQGGGVINSGGGIISMTLTTIMSNTTSGEGAGIANIGGGSVLTLTQVSINGNQGMGGPNTHGAGLYNEGAADIFDSAIYNNMSGMNGGGIANNGNLSIMNSTVSSNMGATAGGGFFIFPGGINTILDSVTVANNMGGTANGIVHNGGLVQLRHTILDNAGSDCGGPGFFGSADYNLFTDPACPLLAPNDFPVGAMLGPLQDNGGPTWSHLPMLGSPAIDTGDPACLDSIGLPLGPDQRGVGRPIDGDGDSFPICDRGAVEAPAAAPMTPVCFTEINGDATTDYSSADNMALQMAVDNVLPGGLIKVAGYCAGVSLRSGVSQTVYISKSLTMQGGYTETAWLAAPDPITFPSTLDGMEMERVVNITVPAIVTLDRLTIYNGETTQPNFGGGIYVAPTAVLNLSNSIVYSNTHAAGGGGGVGGDFDALITISNSMIYSNSASSIGGGISTDFGSLLTITNSQILSNSNELGFGAPGGGIIAQGALQMFNSRVASNLSFGDGAGIALFGGGGAFPSLIDNSLIENNIINPAGFGFGGGITAGDMLTITRSTIRNNNANNGDGGGLTNFAAVWILDGTVIEQNNAFNGGGLNNFGMMIIDDTTVMSNTASNEGGGLYSFGQLEMSNSWINGNLAVAAGGLLNNGIGANFLNNVQINNNTAFFLWGGGVVNNGELTVQNSTIMQNQAPDGGGFVQAGLGSAATISNSTIQENSAMVGHGGGIWADSGTLTVTYSTVATNTAAIDGGGIVITNSSTVSVTYSTVAFNVALNEGGGLLSHANLWLFNSTVSSNNAGNAGGGLRNAPFANTVIDNSTIAANNAFGPGGGGIANNSGLTSKNSIIALNTPNNCMGGPWLSIGFNLYTDPSCPFGPGDQIVPPAALNLGPLQNNGGATWTHALIAPSAAIDMAEPACTDSAGIPIMDDQIGQMRPGGIACDVGAFELQPPDSCFATLDNGGPLSWASPTAAAVQSAVDAAFPGDLIKVAGYCAGVNNRAGDFQTVYVSQTVTIQGGYTNTAWLAVPDPVTYPTTFDGRGNGRGFSIFATNVTLDSLTAYNGLNMGFGGGGIYVSFGNVFTMSNSIVISNSGGGSFGGGLMFDFDVYATVDNVDVVSNTAVNSMGGGIMSMGSFVDLRNSEVGNNVADMGAGMGFMGGGSGTIDSSWIYNNSTTPTTFGMGGGIFSTNMLTITNSTIENNISEGDGGGINSFGLLDISANSIITANQSISATGGGIYASGFTLIDATTITNNSAVNGGGIANGGQLTFTMGTIEGNSANEGAGLLNGSFGFGTAYIGNSNIQNNTAFNWGGGISNTDQLVVDNSSLLGNTALIGAGFAGNNNSDALITDSNVEMNNALFVGGGLFNNGILTITYSHVMSNTASDGAGIFIDNAGTLEFAYATAAYNIAVNDGGGLFALGFAQLYNSTVSNNEAGNQGGAINSTGGAFVNVDNSTIAENSAFGLGGGGVASNAAVQLKNSIVGVNVGGDCGGFGVFSAGFNRDTDGTCSLFAPGDLSVPPAMLNIGPLLNNGGASWTHALIVPSMAIDAADPACMDSLGFVIPDDQRNTARPIGAVCDIGSFEAIPNTAPVANDDNYTATSGITLTVPISGLLMNDTDVENDPLTVISYTMPTTGSLMVNPDGSFDFLPPVGYTGTVTFTYQCTDGIANSNWATVAITVEACILPMAVTPLTVTAVVTDVVLDWLATPNTTYYEIWTGTDYPYFTPGLDCAFPPVGLSCTTTVGLNHTAIGDLGNPAQNYYYKVIAANVCGFSGDIEHVAEFDFAIVPGS